MKTYKLADKENEPLSTMGDRLLFTIWLAGKVLGVDSAKDFADAIGKGATQVSNWVKGQKRPEWDTIKRIADAVGINAVWLDDPTRSEAVEPPDFAEWIRPRREREKLKARRRA